MPAKPAPLTDLEGHILAGLMQTPNATAYDVMKALGTCPLSNLSASAGSIYPAVKRLRERGFIAAKAGRTGQRAHETLKVTRTGSKAVRDWVRQVSPADLLPHDPLRTKLLFVDLLTPAEKERWLRDLRDGLTAVTQAVKSFGSADDVRMELAVANALATVRQRRSLLDKLEADMASAPAADPAEAEAN